MKHLILLFVLVFGLVSCAPKVDQSKTQIEFWTIALSPSYDDYIKGMIRDFEEQHPEVELVWIDLPQQAALQKLMAGIAAGVPPDLVNLNTEFALVMAQNHALVDVDKMVTEEERARYFPGLWEASKYEDGVFAVPWYVTTKVLIYNKRILKEAGWDKAPSTVEELGQMARDVHAKTDYLGYMPAIKIVNDWTMWDVPIVDPQTYEVGFNCPEGVARLEFYRQLFQEGVCPPETLTESYRGAIDRYKAGTLAVLETGPQFLLKVKADAPGVYRDSGVAPFPKTPTNTVAAATMNFAIPRSSKNREWALKLALFLTSPENQLAFDKLVPILPSTVATAEDPFFQEGKGEPLQDEAVRISIEQLKRARDFSLGLPKVRELQRILKENMEGALTGELTSKEALDRAAKGWEKILAPLRP